MAIEICPSCGSDNWDFSYCEDCDYELTLTDVINAYKDAGADSINMLALRNFLIQNVDYFDCDDFADMIDCIHTVRDDYIKDLAYELFGKAPDQLTESERYEVQEALSKEDRRTIFNDTLYYLRDLGVTVSIDLASNQFSRPVFQGVIPENGDTYYIRYYSEYGTAPTDVEFELGAYTHVGTITTEMLPTLTADGYVHTGWVDFLGDPVNVGDTFEYIPTLVAVWECVVNLTVSYVSEHGTAPASKTVTVNEGESYTLTADDLPTLSADGYTFQGWTTNGTPVSVGSTISTDTTLTAVWEEVLVSSSKASFILGFIAGLTSPAGVLDYPDIPTHRLV